MFIVLLFCVIKALKMLKHLLLLARARACVRACVRVCVCVCDFTDSGSSFHKRTLKFYTKEWDCSCLRQWWQSCTQAAHNNRQGPHAHTQKRYVDSEWPTRRTRIIWHLRHRCSISAQTSKIRWHRRTVTEQFKRLHLIVWRHWHKVLTDCAEAYLKMWIWSTCPVSHSRKIGRPATERSTSGWIPPPFWIWIYTLQGSFWPFLQWSLNRRRLALTLFSSLHFEHALLSP